MVGAREKLMVAEIAGSARGFAGSAKVKDDEWQAEAIIALFFDEPATGSLLLEACRARATEPELHAFPWTHGQCPVPGYNAGWDGLSDQIPAIGQLLTQHGFGPHFRELNLALDLAAYEPIESTVTGIDVHEQIGVAGETIFKIIEQERTLAECGVKLLGNHYDDPRAATIGYIDWLWVDESLRRRGVARMLMQRALALLKRQGYTTCWLTTGATNWPAQPLYLSLGFRVVDCSTSYKRPAG
jgi:ribosomal protein S18 acetylase RimI-like enzyme